jgi:hypothetical protein
VVLPGPRRRQHARRATPARAGVARPRLVTQIRTTSTMSRRPRKSASLRV